MSRKKLADRTVDCTIERISHEGRGITTINGRTTFVVGALPGEQARVKIYNQKNKFYEAITLEVLSNPSPVRQPPPCPYFIECGGCSLQHMQRAAQVEHKQQVLLEHLKSFGGAHVIPESILPPLQVPTEHYRTKARLGVRYVAKKNQVLVGFRERVTGWVMDMEHCHILHPKLSGLIKPLRECLLKLMAKADIPQIEIAYSDGYAAMIIRHLDILREHDREILTKFAEKHACDLYLQPEGHESVHLLYSASKQIDYLTYKINDITFKFHPGDFTQVNPEINQLMIQKALQYLDLQPSDRVLDLFCGIGNFTLPISKFVQHTVGIEGSSRAIIQAKKNAADNQCLNVDYIVADLQPKDSADLPIELKQAYDKILLDPPRSGALELIPVIAELKPQKIVYISCNPATLARDLGALLQVTNMRLTAVGVMDMFPHTAHVESIAVLER